MADTFDVEQYISEYAPGGVKIGRLLFIFEHASSKEVQERAGLMALEELKVTYRTSCYTETVNKMIAKGCDVKLDQKMVEGIDERAAQELMKLEQNFGVAKTGVNKEDSRTALKELGMHYYAKGCLQGAMKHFAKMRDYCTSPAHVIEMCVEVIRVGIEAQSWTIVNQHCSRAEQNDAAKDKICLGKIRAAQALLFLESKKYKPAAAKLLEIPAELGDNFSEVIPGSSIVLYTGLLVCATYGRQEIKTNVLNNNTFRPFFDLNPLLFQAVKDLTNSNYRAGLQVLQNLRGTLEFDPVMQPHLDALYEAVTQRWFKQYTAPYTTIDLHRMASAFGYSTPAMEAKVAQLISEGHISARIDSDKKVLHSREDDTRGKTFREVISTGRTFVLNTEDQLRRMNMQQHGFEYVRPRETDAREREEY
eukprot:TRINITY_DN11544_c0_g1_i1.p1 TRINITY_DN11544_c0_g1~~TRINITY_DN11544_c0_g1_i1.p1  ORF type:complete len:440 (+),score=109.02 TRINITY_DN11544_c0_g1_i1:61-1320(+)